VIERSTHRLIAGCPNSVIPEGVTTIASYALAVRLYAVKLPESLTTIEKSAFFGAQLKHLRIPKNVQKIEANAFL
jgi:hypothetical protein